MPNIRAPGMSGALSSLLRFAPQRERGDVEVTGNGGVDSFEEVELDVLLDPVGDQRGAAVSVNGSSRRAAAADDFGDASLIVEEHYRPGTGDGTVDHRYVAAGVELVRVGQDPDLVCGDGHGGSVFVKSGDDGLRARGGQDAQVGFFLEDQLFGVGCLVAVDEMHAAGRSGPIGVD